MRFSLSVSNVYWYHIEFMKRYALPLSILAVIIILIVLMFAHGGGSSSVDYSDGTPTDQPISAEWVRGNASSTVQLVEYSDFQCPACQGYYPLIKQLETEYGAKVAFIYRNYPLYMIHPNADIAARAAEAAGLQGKFWEMHDKLFENHDSWATLLNPEKTFEKYAADLGLKGDQFKIDMASAAVHKAVADDYQRGQRAGVGVQGTPTFVLNGLTLPKNPSSVEGFRALLNQLVK